MGQQEVYDFLRMNRKAWYSSRDISANLGISIGSVTMSLKKLRKSKLIDFKEAGKRNAYVYRIQ
ncbi:MAG: hypothetical protein ABIA93_03630 [Candidatus Woesearchaeota archaeon]